MSPYGLDQMRRERERNHKTVAKYGNEAQKKAYADADWEATKGLVKSAAGSISSSPRKIINGVVEMWKGLSKQADVVSECEKKKQ